jgi:hypothetical protein
MSAAAADADGDPTWPDSDGFFGTIRSSQEFVQREMAFLELHTRANMVDSGDDEARYFALCPKLKDYYTAQLLIQLNDAPKEPADFAAFFSRFL